MVGAETGGGVDFRTDRWHAAALNMHSMLEVPGLRIETERPGLHLLDASMSSEQDARLEI